MFKDTDRELARLEAELLQEQEQPIQEAPPAEETLPEYFYTDTYPEEDPVVYQNYSNGYQAYDDEEASSASSGSTVALTVIACVLSLVVTAVLLLWLLLDRGVLG